MGRTFGNLGVRVRGVVSYALSPYEQKAMAGSVVKGVPNMIRRFNSQVFKIAPPMILAYLYYDYISKESHRMSRKNPDDYKDDV